jgi:hypothetical protein
MATPVTSLTAAASLVPKTAQELATAKLKVAAAAATAAKKPAPVLSTSKVATPKPPVKPAITLPPGIDFAALRAADKTYKPPPVDPKIAAQIAALKLPAKVDWAALAATDAKNKAAQKAKPGGKMVNGVYLPPGIDFAALKKADDAKKAAAAAPVDPLQEVYKKFAAEMKTEGASNVTMYDKIMKEVGGFYDQSQKQMDTDYAPAKTALDNLIKNMGGPASSATIADVPAEIARLKSLNNTDKSSALSYMDMLKSVIPSNFSSISEGVQGDLQQAIMDRAAAEQARKDAALAAAQAAAARRSGGGGGGGGRRSSGSGSSGGGVKNSATEAYTSAIDDQVMAGMTPQQQEMYLRTRRENAGVDVNPSLKAANNKYEYAAAAASPAGIAQYALSKIGTGTKITNASLTAYQKQKAAEAANWKKVVDGMQSISGWGGGTKGTRTTSSKGSYKG